MNELQKLIQIQNDIEKFITEISGYVQMASTRVTSMTAILDLVKKRIQELRGPS